MMVRTMTLALLLAAGAAAQLQLYLHPASGVEEPLTGPLEFGSVPTGDFRDTPLRIRNIGDAAITLERLRVTGQGFSLEGHPSTPYVVAAGTNVDFRVRFRPTGFGSYSGTLRINDSYTMIFGSSPPTVSLSVEESAGFRRLSSGDTVVFGRVERDSRSSRRFLLENPSSKELAVSALAIDSGQFHLEDVPAAPFSLAPETSISFTITFQPDSAGIHRANLVLNQRIFVLEGVGLHPPYPAPEIHLEPQTFTSGQQGTITVRLPLPSPASGAGQVRMSFEPVIEGAGDDPAVQFLATGSRTIPLAVQQGETATLLAGERQAAFQTGTTAGTITFTVELGDRREQASVAIAPTPVIITSGESRPTSTGLELTIIGFDNTRSASQIAFRFFDTTGRPLTAEPIRADVTEPFRQYFAGAEFGGLFSLVAAFPVAGDASLLGSVDVQFTNSAGPAEAYHVTLR